MDVYEKLKELGLTLPEAPAKGGVYTPCKLTEDGYAYISGCGPVIGGVQITGKLGQDVSVEDGQKYAQNCMLNVLAVLERKIGDLNRVADVVKILVFVASADDFYAQPQVANGASNLLVSLFGEDVGAPTRSAVGMNVLPGNIPVEIEAISNQVSKPEEELGYADGNFGFLSDRSRAVSVLCCAQGFRTDVSLRRHG